jgi:hypothetical protein
VSWLGQVQVRCKAAESKAYDETSLCEAAYRDLPRVLALIIELEAALKEAASFDTDLSLPMQRVEFRERLAAILTRLEEP